MKALAHGVRQCDGIRCMKAGHAIAAAALGAALLALIGALAVFEPWTTPGHGAARASFRDCAECPDMLPIPPGVYVMGVQHPRREVWLNRLFGAPMAARRYARIARAFAIGRTEVTFAQWEACVTDGGCGGYIPADEGWGRGQRPVIHVSWVDAQLYVRWLSQKTGHAYRLPSEAEWEYAARTGLSSPYAWGRQPSHNWANYGADPHELCPPCYVVRRGRDRFFYTAPVASFPPNRWGLYDMHGNVYEWTADCWAYPLRYEQVGQDAVTEGDCGLHPKKGGAFYSDAHRIGAHYRAYSPSNLRGRNTGFRVARDR